MRFILASLLLVTTFLPLCSSQHETEHIADTQAKQLMTIDDIIDDERKDSFGTVIHAGNDSIIFTTKHNNLRVQVKVEVLDDVDDNADAHKDGLMMVTKDDIEHVIDRLEDVLERWHSMFIEVEDNDDDVDDDHSDDDHTDDDDDDDGHDDNYKNDDEDSLKVREVDMKLVIKKIENVLEGWYSMLKMEEADKDEDNVDTSSKPNLRSRRDSDDDDEDDDDDDENDDKNDDENDSVGSVVQERIGGLADDVVLEVIDADHDVKNNDGQTKDASATGIIFRTLLRLKGRSDARRYFRLKTTNSDDLEVMEDDVDDDADDNDADEDESEDKDGLVYESLALSLLEEIAKLEKEESNDSQSRNALHAGIQFRTKFRGRRNAGRHFRTKTMESDDMEVMEDDDDDEREVDRNAGRHFRTKRRGRRDTDDNDEVAMEDDRKEVDDSPEKSRIARNAGRHFRTKTRSRGRRDTEDDDDEEVEDDDRKEVDDSKSRIARNAGRHFRTKTRNRGRRDPEDNDYEVAMEDDRKEVDDSPAKSRIARNALHAVIQFLTKSRVHGNAEKH